MVAPPNKMQERRTPTGFRGVTVIGRIASGVNEIGDIEGEFGSKGFVSPRRENRTNFQNQLPRSEFGVRRIGDGSYDFESNMDMESKILPPAGSQILQEYPIGSVLALGFFSSLAAHLLYEFWIRKH